MAPQKRKRCCVPYCNNVQEISEKQFFKIGANLENREKWLSFVGKTLAAKSQVLYCCEDHFDLPNDAENYIRCKYLPGTKFKLRPDVLPQKKLPLNVCRLCLKLIYNGDDFVDISLTKGSKNAQIIAATLPEIDLSITVEPVACVKCFEPLEKYYRIKQNALNSEVVVVNCIKSIVKASPTRLIKNCEIDLFEEYNAIAELLEKGKEKAKIPEEPAIIQGPSKVTQDRKETEESSEEIIIQVEEPNAVKYPTPTVPVEDINFKNEQSPLRNLLEGGNNGGPLSNADFNQAKFYVIESIPYNKVPENSRPGSSQEKTSFLMPNMEPVPNNADSSITNSGDIKYEVVKNVMELSDEDMYIQIEKEDGENVVIVTSQM